MTQRLAFDIETQPNAHRVGLMPEPEVRLGNLKDPVKIREKEAEAKADQLAKAALDANFGRVVCISVAQRESEAGPIKAWTVTRNPAASTEAEVDERERQLLRWFWEFAAARPHFATFNGSTFDVPFLLRRSLLLGVRPYRIDCHPYRVIQADAEHLDVMRVLHDYETGNGTGYKRSLHFYAGLILGELPDYDADMDKGTIGDLFDAGRLDVIERVCRWDAEATLKLAEAVAPVYC